MTDVTLDVPALESFNNQDEEKGYVGKLQEMSKQHSFTTAWTLIDLKNPDELISYHGDQHIVSASIRKLSILSMALDMKLDLGKKITINKNDQVHTSIDSGLLQHFITPFTLSINDLLIMMIAISDTTATGVIIRELGGINKLNEYCKGIGLMDTEHYSISSNSDKKANQCVTTTNDTAFLLRYLLTDERAVEMLKQQKLKEKFPRYLPDVVIAHKGGTGNGYYHDAGIFYKDDKPLFILVVFTDKVENKLEAYELIGKLAEISWNYFSVS
jgi:beta-lactamase class A